MTTYKVQIIDMSSVHDMDDYERALSAASVHYVSGLEELWRFCGGKLHRERCGYAGMRGNTEYIAEPISR